MGSSSLAVVYSAVGIIVATIISQVSSFSPHNLLTATQLQVFTAMDKRRRITKGAGIVKLAETTTSSTTKQPYQKQQHSSGRRWKARRKHEVFLPSPSRDITQQEEDALIKQLTYLPPNVCCVSAYTGSNVNSKSNVDSSKDIDTSDTGVGRPIAIKSYPLVMQLANNNINNSDEQQASNDDTEPKEEEDINSRYTNCSSITPFPTMYWLTCPHISKAISELERNGYVKIFEERILNNVELTNIWYNVHEEYAIERWNLLTLEDQEYLSKERSSMKDILQYSGVAGTDHKGVRAQNADRTSFVPSVKCLHSHYAHYRSQDDTEGSKAVINMVGKWTHELLIEQFPDLVV